MPFQDDPITTGSPIALPDGFDLNPEQEESSSSVLGAAFRLENPIVSAATSYRVDRDVPFDPDYRPYEDIQGTIYEGFSDRFLDVRNADQTVMMKAQIDRELEDRRALDAAGGWGILAEMAGSLLSPTTLLPGGAVVRGVKGGVSVGRTSVSVAGAGGFAVALDELALQGSQQTRTPEESIAAIGGGILLGGLLGGAVGGMSRKAYMRSSAAAERAPEDIVSYNDAMNEFMAPDGPRSVGAAENAADMTLRRQGLFDFFDKSQFRVEQALIDHLEPVMPKGWAEKVARISAAPLAIGRPIVRTDPTLRAQMSDIQSARRAMSDLTESAMQYKVNAEGQTVHSGQIPVETAIKMKSQDFVLGSYSRTKEGYAEYMKDGPIGSVGSVTNPITARWQHLLGKSEKMTFREFKSEVRWALSSSDPHPIPQVAKVAEMERKMFWDKVRDDMIDTDMIDENVRDVDTGNYVTRIYNEEKIRANRRNGTADDMGVVVTDEFKKKRAAAQKRLELDDTVERSVAELGKAREKLRGINRSEKNAIKKARDKRDRAKATIASEGKVQRVTGALRKHFKARAAKLKDGLLEGEELASFTQMIKDVRGVKQLEPQSLLGAIRGFGGIKDPRAKNVWRNADWVSDGTRTDIEEIMDQRAVSIRRDDGIDIDMMREALVEGGYLPDGATVDDLLEAIRKETDGEKVYSVDDAVEVARYEATLELADDLEASGVDVSKPITQIIQALEGKARSQKITKAKAQEAERSGKKAGKAGGDGSTLMRAFDRLEDANARLDELKEIAPKIKEERVAARKEIADNLKSVQKAKDARGVDEYYASKDDLEIEAAVDDTLNAILGLKVGQHSFGTVMARPTRARVLDIPDDVLRPWLEDDYDKIVNNVTKSLVPDIEVIRKFGDLNMTEAKQKIVDEATKLANNAKTRRMKDYYTSEGVERVKDLENVKSRMTGRFGIPDDPSGFFSQAARTGKSLSFMSLLGGMMISALPDPAGVINRSGLETAFGVSDMITNPRRLIKALSDGQEYGAAAELAMNGRIAKLYDVMDEYGRGTKFDRGLAAGTGLFAKSTGMVHWNWFWKSVVAAFVGSRMSKAAMAVANGSATTKQLQTLSANYIDTVMAQRIAKQIDKYADRDGLVWLPQARLWDDAEAFNAFRAAMAREDGLAVITPGQDKPLAFSTPIGGLAFQFKTFAFSAHNRVLLAGVQRLDAEFAAAATTFLILGSQVSNIKAWENNKEPKTGIALAEDALDRSGLGAVLMEGYGTVNALTGGAISVSGEIPSRFQTRSVLSGAAGPAFDQMVKTGDSISAAVRHRIGPEGGNFSERDAKNMISAMPGNNHPVARLLGIYDQVAKAVEGMVNK
tara:strand:- start:997 stop:5073 length:4077 start_codon:yes stop_codon:yes gene_type:complete